jgi:hypothetical protein
MSGKVVRLRLAKIARNATSRHGGTLRSCISYCGLSSSSVVGGSRLPQGTLSQIQASRAHATAAAASLLSRER